MAARRASVTDVLRAVDTLAVSRPGETLWVGIDGPGAAGKTTLAAQVQASVARAVVVHVDDFSGPRVQAWDWCRFHRQVVRPLRSGSAARYQRWDWDTDSGAEWHEIPVGAVVVVEGVSATRSEVDVDWGLTVWVDAPRGVRLARALERDGPERMPRWLEDWMPSEDAYIADQRPHERADLVVDGGAG